VCIRRNLLNIAIFLLEVDHAGNTIRVMVDILQNQIATLIRGATYNHEFLPMMHVKAGIDLLMFDRMRCIVLPFSTVKNMRTLTVSEITLVINSSAWF
jgi:hypothetical protein